MAQTDANKVEDSKPVKKLSAKEQEYRGLVKELSIIFSDLSLEDVKTLAKMNLIADLQERGSAIQYFWVAKNLKA